MRLQLEDPGRWKSEKQWVTLIKPKKIYNIDSLAVSPKATARYISLYQINLFTI